MTTANGTLLFVMCGSNIDVSYSTRYSHNLSSAIAILSNCTVGVFRLILSNVQLGLQGFNGGQGSSRSFSQKLIKLKSVEVLAQLYLWRLVSSFYLDVCSTAVWCWLIILPVVLPACHAFPCFAQFEGCVHGSLGVMSAPPHAFLTTWVLVGLQQAMNE